MSKEEAIERLKYIDMAYNCNNYYSKYDLDCIEKVLQLIEEQDTIINKAKDLLEKYIANGTKCNCGDLQLVIDVLEEWL